MAEGKERDIVITGEELVTLNTRGIGNTIPRNA